MSTAASLTESAGWAATDWPRRARLSYLPTSAEDPEPAYAIAEVWTPPHDMALPPDVCRLVREAAAACEPVSRTNGAYRLPALDAGDRQSILERFEAANRLWWGLAIDKWHLGVKCYTVGEAHPEHQDLHAGAARRKIAGSVQLSDDHEYDGGTLIVRFASHRLAMARDVGTVVVFPGWSVHEVEPVSRGERWPPWSTGGDRDCDDA